jgi:ABC-type bacteriocin/lantibiotic exporter with double-glycine peptidase domain
LIKSKVKRRSIDKNKKTSHKSHSLSYLLSAFVAITPLIVHLVFSEKLNPILIVCVSFSFSLLIYGFSEVFLNTNNEDLFNSNNEKNDESMDFFERFETIKSIKNQVKDVLQDENQRKNNLDVCNKFLVESTELNRIINEILNIDVHVE